MTNVRTAALGAALMLGIASVAEAQQRAPEAGQRARPDRGAVRGGDRARPGRMGMLFRGIELTEAQRTQIRAINERYQPRFQELRATVKTSVEGGQRVTRADTALRTQIRALMEQRQNEVRGVLTAEQQVVFDRNVQQMRERAQARGERRRSGGDRPGTDRAKTPGERRGTR